MTICPQCNTQNEAGAVFCDQCGAALAPAANGGAAAADLAAANVCPVCGAAAIPGDAFCNECGAAATPALVTAATPALVTAATTAATTAGVNAAPSAPAPAQAPAQAAAAPAAYTPHNSRRAQIVTGDGLSVELAGKASYLIGREDPVSGIYPEIDTTRSDGDAAGVSRRHAEIVQQSNQWFLQDLNSTNGSFVNNQRVPPQARHPLHSGDQIRLGKWVATFQVN